MTSENTLPLRCTGCSIQISNIQKPWVTLQVQGRGVFAKFGALRILRQNKCWCFHTRARERRAPEADVCQLLCPMPWDLGSNGPVQTLARRRGSHGDGWTGAPGLGSHTRENGHDRSPSQTRCPTDDPGACVMSWRVFSVHFERVLTRRGPFLCRQLAWVGLLLTRTRPQCVPAALCAT